MIRFRLFPILLIVSGVWLPGCKKEVDPGIAPIVLSTDPANQAVGVVLNGRISATFSSAMDPASMTIAQFTVRQGTTIVPGTVTFSGTTATFIATQNLSPNTSATATITTGAKDVSGRSLSEEYTWTFSTGPTEDSRLPTVWLTNPDTSAVEVPLNQLITVTFSESMDPASITATTFTLRQGTTLIPGMVNTTGAKATFTPSVNLEPNKIYVALIDPEVKDMAGNALGTRHIYAFTTLGAPDLERPTIVSTDPVNNVTGVTTNKVIVINFSESMDPLTLTTASFRLNQGATPVTGTVAVFGTLATFTPSTVLTANTTYTATVTNAAKDRAGNSLASNAVWSFSTQ